MIYLVLSGDIVSIEKLNSLKKSFEEGIVPKKEFEKTKDGKKKEDKEEKSKKEITKRSDKFLIMAIVFVLLFIIAFFFIINYKSQSRPKTIGELHQLNLEKGLPLEQGYTYNGFSFVKTAGLWHTQIQSESGRILYGIAFRFSPRELEDIKITGTLNNSLFNSEDEIYVTFDSLGENLQYIALAIGEFDQSITKSFRKIPVAACIKNETEACKTRPIITCENTNKPVVYFKQDEKTRISYKNNCIVIQGQDIEITRATDRMLMQFYGIMG